jgi:hypothetical protein
VTYFQNAYTNHGLALRAGSIILAVNGGTPTITPFVVVTTWDSNGATVANSFGPWTPTFGGGFSHQVL